MSRTSTPQGTRTATRIRQEFIEFFAERHGHTFVPSSLVAPHDDPTLLFTNAGMNQFKDVFLGQGTRDYQRAVNSQKCIRAGGKHNDLEDVGRDHYHHTYFEMLGNWSFGDYFKAEAIEWAWELLTSPAPVGWGLDKDRLFVTVFGGDEKEGLAPDLEAEELWTRYVDRSRISRWGKKDNFWEMGETGPCGPCSEIHYDFTPDLSGAGLVNLDDPRVVELWNLVFIQYSRHRDRGLSPLPAKHVDTGMGLERLVRVLQHKDSNYDIDLFTPIFAAIETHSGAHPYRGELADPVDIAYRVIADHIRCLTMAITDGAWPSNEGRGYVLRRILRRAVRHAHQTLETRGPWLHELVPTVVATLGDAFPELTEHPDKVATVIHDEEESFLRTLDRGIALFDKAVTASGETGSVQAADAFKLHDTYGFPIDLTRVMAQERGLRVDEPGFETLMEAARQRSRRTADDDNTITLPPEAIAGLEHMGVEPTDDGARDDAKPITAELRAIYNGNDFDEVAEVGTRVALILNRTNHYAQGGGQVGDHGNIFESSEAQGEGHLDAHFNVEDTRAFGGYVLHIGHVTEHQLVVGAPVNVTVDRHRREPTRANHTATHLLNFALRYVLGPEEDQRGSLVAPDRLRFDFACTHAMSDEQIEDTQRVVNEQIDRALPVDAAVVPLETARGITGVRAIFGEKYPDPVRVVAIGATMADVLADPANERWNQCSIELCGGTHLPDTSAARCCVIVHEQALAAGVRRITAVTGTAALAAVKAGEGLEQRARRAAELDGEDLLAEHDEITELVQELTIGATAHRRIDALIESLKTRVRELRKEHRAEARSGVVEAARKIADQMDGPVIVTMLPDADRENLLSAMDAIRATHDESAVMLLGVDDVAGRVTIVARVPKGLIGKGLKAGDWVREPAQICGGRGGGRPDMAQAGGKDPDKVREAISAARAFALDKLS